MCLDQSHNKRLKLEVQDRQGLQDSQDPQGRQEVKDHQDHQVGKDRQGHQEGKDLLDQREDKDHKALREILKDLQDPNKILREGLGFVRRRPTRLLGETMEVLAHQLEQQLQCRKYLCEHRRSKSSSTIKGSKLRSMTGKFLRTSRIKFNS